MTEVMSFWPSRRSLILRELSNDRLLSSTPLIHQLTSCSSR